MISPEQIAELSRKYQIDQYTILREYLQLMFLSRFYEEKNSQEIYFKGGTAIHFLLGSFRFSEDLDFTSLIPVKDIRPILARVMKRLSGEITGLEIKNLGVKEHALTEIIKYHYEAKHPLTIRLEFSLREKPLTRTIDPIETIFPVSPYPLVVHLDSEELLAEKARALLTREQGRDIFDFWFLLSKGIVLREDYIKNKMRWYKRDYHQADLTLALERFGEKELARDLNKFLPRNYRGFVGEIKGKLLEKYKSVEQSR